MTSVRNKVTLPELPYDYAALEPVVCREIMEVNIYKLRDAKISRKQIRRII